MGHTSEKISFRHCLIRSENDGGEKLKWEKKVQEIVTIKSNDKEPKCNKIKSNKMEMFFVNTMFSNKMNKRWSANGRKRGTQIKNRFKCRRLFGAFFLPHFVGIYCSEKIVLYIFITVCLINLHKIALPHTPHTKSKTLSTSARLNARRGNCSFHVLCVFFFILGCLFQFIRSNLYRLFSHLFDGNFRFLSTISKWMWHYLVDLIRTVHRIAFQIATEMVIVIASHRIFQWFDNNGRNDYIY